MTFPTLKLTYFDLPARAEGTRMMLRLAGVPFDDERVPRDMFAELKATLPYGQVPVLTINGEVLAETQAIQRYVARLTGMYPMDDPVAAALVEEIVTTVSDAYETKIIASFRESDADKRQKMREVMAKISLPTILRQVEARLEYMAMHPYFQRIDNKVWLHEVVLYRFVTTLASGRFDPIPPTITDGYVRINATHNKILAAIEAGPAPVSLPAIPPTPVRPKKLKLTYLDVASRGEFIRLALHIGGIAFEDERITFADIPARKLPYGQVPVLEIDGIIVAQSFALLRYASWIGGLYPVHEPLVAARMDEFIARAEELYHTFQASFDTKDLEERRTIREHILASNVIPMIATTFEKRILQWKQPGPFIFGETVSIADLAVYHLVDFFKGRDYDYVPGTFLDAYTTLTGIHSAVRNHPRVQDWYATR